LPEIQKELDGRYSGKSFQAFAISTGDPEYYLTAFKEELNVSMPWLSMNTRLINPYYLEVYEQWELNQDHPTAVLLDTRGVIRYRGSGDGTGVANSDINYREMFDMIGTLLEEAGTPTGREVGNRAIDFTLSDILNDEEIKLSEHFDKPILLTFWGTGCLECGDLVPGVYAQNIQEMYGGPSRLNVIGVDHHTPTDFLHGFVLQNGIEYPVLVDESGNVFGKYRIRDEFIFIVLDTDGIIRYRGTELSHEIIEVLDEIVGRPEAERAF
jgi:peroxiredoxin